eukprot:TRINITY_DN4305_c0_g1_i2.p1 TRINITY_DN4305_c0_g1~~TRINITY_DN4305_c0_g1_i2.p1  ORF type:complete len:164 (-),score=26.72 TRINITY_DN4305_c0_g1_i2:88-579(-)
MTDTQLIEAAEKWLSSHPEGLKLNVVSDSVAFTPINATLYSLTKENTHITIGFHEPLKSSDSLKRVAENFNFIALNKLPLPGLDHPSDWDVKPVTPVSSFSEGVEIQHFDGNKIKIHVKTRFFAIYGNIPSLQTGCGPSPKGSYFQVRKDFHGEIVIEAPIKI